MAKVKFSKKEFEKSIKITPEIETKINLFGTPLEAITDSEIEIEIFPNRPDLLSLQGYLRAFKAFLGKSTGLKKYKINKPEKNYKVKVEKEVKSVRPYTVCAIVKNLLLNDENIKEIINLQEKLHNTIGRNRKKAAIGIYPLEKIKLPITYTAKKPQDIKFQPLEFEGELTGLEILQKHPTGIKYAHCLKGAEKYPIFIDAGKKILSMPPIINSHDTGKVEPSTKSVFIECSGFDLNILEKILNIIVTALADMGGSIYQMEITGKDRKITPDFSTQKMKISLEMAKDVLGIDLTQKDLERLLPKMEYNYKNGIVEIPPWRTDILHPIDIIEDILISYGYDNIQAEIPTISTIAEESKYSKIRRKISEILIGLGHLEISTYHLIKESEFESFSHKDKIELLNSKTEYNILRNSLLSPAIKILSENVDAEYPQKLFEIGKVFSKSEKTETGIRENESLVLAMSPSNFTMIKQHLDAIMHALSLSYSLEESEEKSFIVGRTAKIVIDKKEIGHMGEIHPNILRKYGIKMPLAVLEINLDKIYSLLS